MTTLKDTIYKILLEQPETRDSDKKLQWAVLDILGYITYVTDDINGELKYKGFFQSPAFESIRRCRQALQRSDLLTGAKLIQPTPKVKKQRVKLSKEKGFSYQYPKFEFDPINNSYKEL